MARRSVPSVEDLRPAGDPLTFAQPAPLEEATTDPQSPSPDPEASPSPWPSPEPEPAAWASDPGWSDAGDALAETSPAPTSSGASSGEGRGALGRELLGPKKIGELARGAVIAGGDALHELLARDEAAAAVELWKADEEDAAAIGDPLGRIAARHNPLGEVMGDNDTADGIEAMVGLGVYLVKQFSRWRAARSLRRAAVLAAESAAAPEEAPAVPDEPAPVPAGPMGRWPGEGADPRPLVG